ncbi:MAG: helix-hairpin-helix domain-containing protein [Phycisphaerales bacterium]|nr:helix-hairpin-helix domain-containing protein [Phycisphaerales bacterium]
MGWSIFGREPRVELAGRPVAPAAPVTMAPAGPERRPGLPRPDSGAPEEEAAGLLDLNTASAAQLELLPSIGPSLARRIVEYRGANGKFGSVSDLDKVSGIGPLTLEKVRPLVTVK